MLIQKMRKHKNMVAVLVAVTVIGTANISEAWIAPVVRIIAASWKACPPEVKAQIASAAVHTAVFVTGALMYSLKSSGTGSHKANATDIKRTGEVTWVDLTDGKTVKQADTTAKTSTEGMKNKAKNNPSKYPKLSAAAKTKDAIDKANFTAAQDLSTMSGKIIKCDDGTYRTLGTVVPNSQNHGSNMGGSSTVSYYPAGNRISITNIYSGPNDQWGNPTHPWDTIDYYVTGGAVPTEQVPEIDATNEQFANKLRNGAPENVYSDYYGEIDDYLKSNPNVVHFVDAQEETTEAMPEYASLAKQEAVAAADAAASASSAATSAQTAASNARARANANPNDMILAGLADKAEADAAAAEANAQEAYKKQIEAENKAQEDEEETTSTVGTDGEHEAYGVDGEFNFGDRISSFVNTIRNSALFSMPSRVLGEVPTGGSPVQTIEMGNTFGTHTMDWSRFDAVWAILRATFLICMGVVSVKLVTRGGGG